MKTTIKFLFTLLILFAFSCDQEASLDPLPIDLDGVSAKASKKEKAKIESPFGIKGKSDLYRNENEISANFSAKDLYPGAYTIWWVIWNYPTECEGGVGACGSDADFGNPDVGVDVLYAGGGVVGKNGKANISGYLEAGDVSGSVNGLFGLPPVGGLLVGNTFMAEVHIVLRTHGPVVPELLDLQISSYGGGCNPLINYDPFTVYPNEIGECGDIAFSIHPPAM